MAAHNKTTSATCPLCNTHFASVPVDGDEDGNAYAALEVTPCAECGALLCAECPQFHSDCCGLHFCASHLVVVEDGTERPLQCCTACAAIPQDDEMPPPIPAQRETRHAEPAIAARCPECLSAEIRCEAYAFVDAGTGYSEAGEQFRCNACGAVGEACEVIWSAPRVVKPIRRESAAAPNEFTQTA